MKICVIGGGAAGIMAAYGAAAAGNTVTLLEKNEKIGKKIFITGKGRCNVTNACGSDELMSHVIRNPRFLYSAFDALDNQDMYRLIEEHGTPLKIERGDRVFPVSDHSYDVINALKLMLGEMHVNIRLKAEVKELITENGPDGQICVTGVKLANGERLISDRVIMATGGCSYPTTGSDGSAFEIARKLGHTVTPLRPGLVPLECSDEWIPSLQGLALKNVRFSMYIGHKKKFDEMGEMLFTHFGISGPIVLSGSSHYEEGTEAYIDLKPALSTAQLDDRLLREFADKSNKNFDNALDDLFPKRLIPVMIELSGIDPYKKVHQITGEERTRFGELIKKLPVHIIGTRGFEEAIITRGGINVKEVNPSDMKSKLVEGLSFAGEMLDLDAVTGGFNLQIAWSTGYLAGNRA